ncbi:hypothetical protein MBRA_00221 [Methylobacterium brachiatum]|nr:hypothetical protein MBRA_00221 [Methylobacterium brachiatum]
MSSKPLNQYSPLRYPGGKGKLSSFVAAIVKQNKLADGLYVEPYAGGAAVAWDLLLTGQVKRVAINDLNRSLYAFWDSVLNNTQELVSLIEKTPIDMGTRDRQKAIMSDPDRYDNITLGFALFFLNRTNRSGILNGGVIGGRDQSGPGKMDARFNKSNLIDRIEAISRFRRKITLTNLDAVHYLKEYSADWGKKTLVYLDPPYFEKGRDLYYDFYKADDHANVAIAVHQLNHVSWVVSYDDVGPIADLYRSDQGIRYSIGYSARKRVVGKEAMFFSAGLMVPEVHGSMIELERWGIPAAALV